MYECSGTIHNFYSCFFLRTAQPFLPTALLVRQTLLHSVTFLAIFCRSFFAQNLNAKNVVWPCRDCVLLKKRLNILVQILFASYLCSHDSSSSCVPSLFYSMFWISILENLALLARNETIGSKRTLVKNICNFVDFLGSVSNTRYFEGSNHWLHEWRTSQYWSSLHWFISTIHGRVFHKERAVRSTWLWMEFNLFDSCNYDIGYQSVPANREDLIWICKFYHSDSSHETLSWTNYQIDSATFQYCKNSQKQSGFN